MKPISVYKVKKDMILRESEGGHSVIIQALSSAQFVDIGNGKPDSFCQFNAINLITADEIVVGAAYPDAPYGPSLELIGKAIS